MKQHRRGGRRGRPRLLEERVQVSAYLPRELAEEAERLRGAEPWSSWIRGLIEREVEEASMTRDEWKEIFAEAGARVRAPYRSNPASQPGISTPTLGTMWREGEGDRAKAEAGIVDQLEACGVPRHVASEVLGREAIVLEWDDGWREVRLPARHWPELGREAIVLEWDDG